MIRLGNFLGIQELIIAFDYQIIVSFEWNGINHFLRFDSILNNFWVRFIKTYFVLAINLKIKYCEYRELNL